MTADRCKETTTTTGTGDITLLGAVTQFQAFGTAFTSFPATVSYAIVGQSGTEWEVGVGTLTDATTLERTTVQASSNAGATVSFSAGTKDVFATVTAQDIADIAAAIAGKAAAVHTHAIADTTGLQTVLDGKSATGHGHAAGDITGLAASATTDAIPRANHTGTQAISTVTGLQTALDDKAALAAANTFTANGALSAPAVRFSGSVITGGTGTTTQPFMLFSPTGATLPTTFSTSGSWMAFNSATGFAGNILTVHVNGAAAVLQISGSGIINATRIVDIGGTMGMWASAFELGSNNSILFSSTTGYTGAADAGIKRNAAGVIEVNSGTAGTFRDLKLRTLISDERIRFKTYTVAGLSGISSPTLGDEVCVTDATAPTYLGALTGGGSVVCNARYNGSAWVSC